MASAGINVVRIGEFTWGLCEREEGKYDFAWLGRVMDGMGEPIDGKGPLRPGPSPYPFRNAPPPAHCGIDIPATKIREESIAADCRRGAPHVG